MGFGIGKAGNSEMQVGNRYRVLSDEGQEFIVWVDDSGCTQFQEVEEEGLNSLLNLLPEGELHILNNGKEMQRLVDLVSGNVVVQLQEQA